MTNLATCPECGANLTAEQAGAGICPRCEMRLALGEATADTGSSAAGSGTTETPERIGPYSVIRSLGEGGMGEVFLAEQHEPIRRQVAIKLIKRGMDTKHVIARFEAERQALALMDHSAIAQVFEAGATAEGRPYFVMEYVQGEPVTAYADRWRLTLSQRLDLFGKICAGVQHAHQKGVIHRDLKPSNVLVVPGDGPAGPSPKIIDFGVAKAISKRLTEQTLFTELGIMIGTPEYMSPEQAELSALDVDTRTDVYSLGVILYELLTGVLPFDSVELRRAGYEEIRRKIKEEEPATPSSRISTLGATATEAARARRIDLPSLRRALAGDLDWIVIRALAKERDRRYGSPAEFAADVDRYLRDEPVVARPPSAAYKARKFVRRNRLLVTSVTLVLITLLAGIVGTATFGLREAREREAADSARSDLEQVVTFQQGMLRDIDAEAMGRRLVSRLRGRIEGADDAIAFDRSVSGINSTDAALDLLDEEILANASERIGSQFADQPIVEGRLRRSLGGTYYDLGLLDRARVQYERAYELLRDLGDKSDIRLSVTGNLGRCYWQLGRLAEAEPLMLEVLAGNRRLHGEDHVETAGAMSNLGLLYMRSGRFQEAHDLHQASLPIYRRVVGEDDPLTLTAIGYLAVVLYPLGRGEEAVTLFQQQLDARRRVLGDDDPATLEARGYLADALKNTGRLDEARILQQEVFSQTRDLLGATHFRTLGVGGNLAGTYSALGEEPKAEAMYRELLALSRERNSGDNRITLQLQDNLARSLLRQGRVEEAAAEFEQIVDGMSRLYPRGDYRTIAALTQLVKTYDPVSQSSAHRKAALRLADWIREVGDGAGLPANSLNSIAWGLLFSYPEGIRDPERALAFSLLANEMTGHQHPLMLDTLAFAYFETGDVSSAIDTEKKALGLVPSTDADRRAEFEANLARFEAALDVK